MKIAASIVAALACSGWILLQPAARAANWAPSPSGDCIDFDSMSADSTGRLYFKVNHSGKRACSPTDPVEGIAVDCNQAILATSRDRIIFYAYSDGSRQWEPAEAAPDKTLAATIVFACLINW
jgi:hypothetical protein